MECFWRDSRSRSHWLPVKDWRAGSEGDILFILYTFLNCFLPH